jgi:transposase
MGRKNRRHSAAFKAQVAIEAIKEAETLSELSKRIEISPQMIANWKREFISHGSEIFSSKAPDEEAAKREKVLYEKIGRLEVEVDFCKRVSEQLGIKRSSKR